jgi:hypothetical protein
MVKGQRSKDNDPQNTTKKTKDRATWTPLKTGNELRCPRSVSSVSSVFVSRTYSTEAVLSSFLPFHDQDAATTVSRELTIFSLVLNWNYTLWVIIDAHLISSNSKRELLDFTTVLLTLLGHLSSFPVFNGVHVARSLVFFVVFCGSLSFGRVLIMKREKGAKYGLSGIRSGNKYTGYQWFNIRC